MSKIELSPLDELFLNDEGREDANREKVMDLPLIELSPFNGHPFRVAHDEELNRLTQSIKDYSVLSPAIARPKTDGGYELISGHRRKAACEALGMDKLPVLVRDMTDDEAVIIMVDSNIQRENLLPSEKAFAYKMKLEALNRQLGRPKENRGQVGHNYSGVKSRDIVADNTNESARQIQRYIRLTELIQPILKMVDDKKIAFNPAVEISYPTEEEQRQLHNTMQSELSTPSISQAQRMKKLSADKKLTDAQIFHILTEEKGNQKEQIHFSKDSFKRYFPKNFTEKQMEDTIKKLLFEWQRKEQRKQDQER
jgi:ParB family chromosome partitioning protein